MKDRKNSIRGSAAEKKETIESKPEFRLPAGGRNPASGAAERWDAVCGDSEQAEDFCDHGAKILAGLVGHLRGDQNFFKKDFVMLQRCRSQLQKNDRA